jgi:hypothetical protein
MLAVEPMPRRLGGELLFDAGFELIKAPGEILVRRE